ncbi:MAG: AraC family transcriptional regulator [Polyangiales bacterium]
MLPELTTQQPCYSVRLVIPFVRLLRRYPSIPPEVSFDLEKLDPDERMPIATLHELLRGAIELTGDHDIGLKAAREIAPGDHGALEYSVRSAATWREACECVGRYMRLVNDDLQFSLRTEGDRAHIQLDSSQVLPRTVADFQSAAFHICARFLWPENVPVESEVYFVHPRPPNIEEYSTTFGGASLRFEAPWNGFVVPLAYLDQPLESADPKLHALIRQHAEALLAELPRAKTVTESVRELISKALAGGPPTVQSIAQKLTMSPRTLSRRLEQENTTFKQVVEDMRQRMALRYVAFSDVPLAEIAYLLGFSQSAAFHRAFKRWTRQTPLEYRRGQRSGQGSPSR